MNLYIIIATVLVSIAAFQRQDIFDRLKFNAYQIKHHNQWYRLFSGGLIHADFMHLGFNMLALWTLGDQAETFFQLLVNDTQAGSLVYLGFYISAIPMSSLYSFEKHKNDVWYNAVGASGAVSAVLFCYIAQYPFQVFVWPPLPGFLLGILYLGGSWYMARRGSDNIGHDAHFFGAVYGLLVTVICDPKLILHLFS